MSVQVSKRLSGKLEPTINGSTYIDLSQQNPTDSMITDVIRHPNSI